MSDSGELMVRHKVDVDAYYLMAEVGILTEADRVELIDGEIIEMAPIGSDHAATVDGLFEVLVLAGRGLAIVRCQAPVRLDRLTEPEPDFAVLRLQADRYRAGHPSAGDTLLIVEVSDSSLRYDRRVKLPLYARFAVPEVWIVDLTRRVVEAHRRPAGEAYAEVTEYRAGATIALAAAPEIVVTLTRAVFG